MGMIYLLFIVGIYMLPTIVAHSNNKKSGCAIAFLNVALGWTLVGWVAAMVWALVPDEKGG